MTAATNVLTPARVRRFTPPLPGRPALLALALFLIVGGVIVFVWSAVAHVATPLGTMGLKPLPDETRQIASFTAIPSSGMYFFPGMDRSKK